ncbi:RloB family protein [Streptomyces sp. BPTC-684]|uniref:RloB family protein n=1 Tax=Streptomyces sp. BPTC-684 TaxID=3043734 RepID=UPI0024B113BA|nr:RloB family protein [Streptomyces sp. BPTC-684]WHM37930.1 RloB family protein [Streptomyces sp. BPTC-684]
MARQFPREGSGRRRGPVRQSSRTLLIVCGGKETERQYLQGLRDHLRNPAISLVVRGKACSPTQLVAYARQQRDLNRGGYDEVWCVFDVDQYADVPEAVTAARRCGIRAAVSNPCFELWLLLHFTEHRAYAATYKQLLPHLQKHLPGYDKTRLDFAVYQGRHKEAAGRARKLDPTGTDHLLNPSTGVWCLTDRMTKR